MLPLSNIHWPMCANMLVSTDLMVPHGPPPLDSISALINLISSKKMIQSRKSLSMNSRLRLKALRATAKDQKQESEWETKSTCLSSTIPKSTQFTLPEKVVVVPASPEPTLQLLLVSGTRARKCQTDNFRMQVMLMISLRRWLSTLRPVVTEDDYENYLFFWFIMLYVSSSDLLYSRSYS